MFWVKWTNDFRNQLVHSLGSVYSKPQRQRCDNSAMTLAILFSLKTMESLQIEVVTHFQASPLISMTIESLASSQSCHRVDADAWCKRALSQQFKSDSLDDVDDVNDTVTITMTTWSVSALRLPALASWCASEKFRKKNLCVSKLFHAKIICLKVLILC